ncbi:hypothetical protein ACFL1U_03045 [Patescibacteria group bacterium]
MAKVTSEQIQHFLKLLNDKKVERTQMSRLLRGGHFSDLLEVKDPRKIDRDKMRLAMDSKELPLKVTITKLARGVLPNKSTFLKDRIAAGKYDDVEGEFTHSRFPITFGGVERNLVLARFNRIDSIETVERWATANGYELAKIEDLLGVGSLSEHKDGQFRFRIICLGSSTIVDGDSCVPTLNTILKSKSVWQESYSSRYARLLSLDSLKTLYSWCCGPEHLFRYLFVRK